MAHFLIADDESGIRRDFRLLLESQNHTCVEACDRIEVGQAVKISESEAGDSFDLILLDYDFNDGTNGLEVMQKLGVNYCEHRVIVLTGSRNASLPSEFARLGAIGHLLKPVSADQFWVTIGSALTRREQFIDKKEDWEAALDLLHKTGVLEGLENYNAINNQLVGQLEALKAINDQLQSELKQAGRREEEIARAYEKASDALGIVPGDINVICSSLHNFGFTKPFLSDVETLFDRDRLHFYVLTTYLKRIEAHPDYPHRLLIMPTTPNHSEYRVGRSYRLYFRRDDSRKVILERFGHKQVQEQIIEYLSRSDDKAMSWDGRSTLFMPGVNGIPNI